MALPASKRAFKEARLEYTPDQSGAAGDARLLRLVAPRVLKHHALPGKWEILRMFRRNGIIT